MHQIVNNSHKDCGERSIHINGIEGFWSLLKRVVFLDAYPAR
jgi:hypothetical protein